ncbi:MAG: SDR family oxidoreductase [Rhodospirillales bacterium]|nr:SDR family oxidoreductase [Rhodospirillales bacterium]
MAKEFEGKIALVTGGSRGIGRAIGAAFAREGAQTVLVATSEKNLAAAADAIAKSGAKPPLTIAADLRQPAECERVFQTVRNKFGRLDILVNNAGATRAGNFTDLSEEMWQDGFALKFFGCVRLCRHFWPMLKAAQGHVISVIGGAARTPDPGFLIGGSVNAAMHNFPKGLSALGRPDGVNVNAILPGMTETERVEQLFKQRAEAAGTTPDKIREQTVKKDGLKRLGLPEDSAELALFLCSERARHIQGTAIAVDGGSTAGVF